MTTEWNITWDSVKKLKSRAKFHVLAGNTILCRLELRDELFYLEEITYVGNNNFLFKLKRSGDSNEFTTAKIDVKKFASEELYNFFENQKYTTNLEWLYGMPVNISANIYMRFTWSPEQSAEQIPSYVNDVNQAWIEWEKYFDGEEKSHRVSEIKINKCPIQTDSFVSSRIEMIESNLEIEIEEKGEPSKIKADTANIDINTIFVVEEPPRRGGIGDYNTLNDIYECDVYWPKQYLDDNICDGDTLRVYNVQPDGVPEVYWMPHVNNNGVPYYYNNHKLYSIRMLGIDAPEIDHKIGNKWADGGTKEKYYPEGKAAQRHLYNLLTDNGKSLGIHIIVDACNMQTNRYRGAAYSDPQESFSITPGDFISGHDAYGRRLGIIYAYLDTGNGKKQWVNINRTMIARGLVTHLPHMDITNDLCHRSQAEVGRPPIEAWGMDDMLPRSPLASSVLNHYPRVYTPGRPKDDRDEVLGDFDPMYQVRIGDCQFIVPPEQISVNKMSRSQRVPVLRSKGSIRKDSGYYITRIQMSIYFSGLEQINGTVVENFIRNEDGKIEYLPGAQGEHGLPYYFVNGLRSLIAQFKRTPFLPIENHLLNEIHNIDAVCLVGLSLSTVQGFPDTVKATLSLLEFDYRSYMPLEKNFSDCFDWPLFRYYYQTALFNPLRLDHSDLDYSIDELKDPAVVKARNLDTAYLSDRTFLRPVTHEWTGDDFLFFVVDEESLLEIRRMQDQLGRLRQARISLLEPGRDSQYNKKGESVHTDDESIWNDIELILQEFFEIKGSIKEIEKLERAIDIIKRKLDAGPGLIPFNIPDLICTGLTVHYENKITQQQLQLTPIPTQQYLGSQDTYVNVSFQTSNEETVKLLRQLHERTTRLIRNYHDIIDNDLLVVRQEYINLFGIGNCSIEELSIHTVPNYPGVYEIQLVLVDVQRTARRMAELQQYASNAFTTDDPKKKALYLKELEERTIFRNIDDMIVEDLDTEEIQAIREGDSKYWAISYMKVKKALKYIELYPDLELPTFKELREVGFYIYNTFEDGEEQIFVDPDFYIRTSTPTLGAQIEYALRERHQIDLWDNLGSQYSIMSPSKIDASSSMGAITPDGDLTINSYDKVNVRSVQTENTKVSNEILYATSINIYKVDENNEKIPIEIDRVVAFSENKRDYIDMHSVIVCIPKTLKNKIELKRGDYIILDELPQEFMFLNEFAFKVEEVTDTSRENNKADVTVKIYMEDENACKIFNSSKAQPSAYYTTQIEPELLKLNVFIEENDNGEPVRLYFPFKAPDGVKTSSDKWIFMVNNNSDVYVSNYGEGGQGKMFKCGYYYIYFEKKLEVGSIGKLVFNAAPIGETRRVRYDQMTYNPILGKIEVGKDWGDLIESFYEKTLPVAKKSGRGLGGSFSEIELQIKKEKMRDEKFREIITELLGDQKVDVLMEEGMTQFNTDYGDGPTDDIMNHDPVKTFSSSCHDLVTYDKRNRLVRAFPTFHLSLIDEGKIIGQWKLHDNFYGYQALSRISVHKSRKSVADTCVIELVNCFKNLTNYDLENSDYYGRPTMWEAIKALWLSENYVKDYLENRRPRDLTSAYLKPGTRVSLRLGYGSNAQDLPVVFNGCITELGGEDIVTIVCQSDGIELTSVISAQQNATTGTWPSITSDDFFDNTFSNKTEPRHLICDMLASRGGFWKNLINKISNDRFFNYNPLGIVHFGSKDININNMYGSAGELGQNIYRGNSDAYRYNSKLFYSEGDTVFCMSLFNKTPWDVIQTCAMATPDFIASVVPFGFRSTIFFGKPYFMLVYDYYQVITKDLGKFGKQFEIREKRKAFQQLHYYTSFTDIVSNNITASEDEIYTNVIGTFRSLNLLRQSVTSETPVIHTDTDIWPEKQRTAVVDTSIVCRGLKAFEVLGWIPIIGTVLELANKIINAFVHEERVAERVARSVLRDYLKDMYKGELLVFGDPTVKPYDLVYISDIKNRMSGMCEIKEIVHTFAEDTGFVTSITPDLCVVNEDTSAIYRWNWIHSVIINGVLNFLGDAMGNIAAKTLGLPHPIVSWTKASLIATTNVAAKASIWLAENTQKGIDFTIKQINNVGETGVGQWLKNLFSKTADVAEGAVKTVVGKEAAEKVAKEVVENSLDKIGKGIVDILKETTKGISTFPGRIAQQIADVFSKANLITFIIETVVIEALCSSIGEAINRWARNRQAVIMLPLKREGIKLLAGVNGHMGCVYGDALSPADHLVERLINNNVLKFLFPQAGYKYMQFRDMADSEIQTDSYKSKLIEGLAGDIIEAQSNRYDPSPSNTENKNTLSQETSDAKALDYIVEGAPYIPYIDNKTGVPYYIPIYKPELLSMFSPPNGHPPVMSSAAGDREKFIGASKGLTCEGMISYLYPGNGKTINLKQCGIRNNIIFTGDNDEHSAPILTMEAYLVLRDKILPELQEKFNDKDIKITISSAFRTADKNKESYGSYRFSDHCTGVAIDIAGITFTNSSGKKEEHFFGRVYRKGEKFDDFKRDPALGELVRCCSDGISGVNGAWIWGPKQDMKNHYHHLHVTLIKM